MKDISEFTNEEHIEHLETGVVRLWITGMFTGNTSWALIDKMLVLIERRKALR